ncbi:MAG: hypothetical protein J2P41_18120 [Blastocatellia bacterium]|nr:hypothetical protein [Blastocatellia bacterium]
MPAVILRLSYLAIPLLTVLLFIPMIGHGFIHDDFLHLSSVAFDPIWRGLTKATGGQFYAPLTWLTFKLDWMLWGMNPAAFAVVNLVLHLANILLLHRLAFALYQSGVAARWAAIGFALLYPANTWAIMWISTRAHILVTLFYLAALLSTIWYTRTKRHKLYPLTAIVVFAILSMFAKESGVTIPVAIALVIYNQRITQKEFHISRSDIIKLSVLLLTVLLLYAGIRSQSGAIPITFSRSQWYTYMLDPKVLAENLLRYGWRTYGLMAIMAGAIALSGCLRGCVPSCKSLAKNEIYFSLCLFAITIAPFILLPGRSGIYTYLPGIAASLLLGAVVRSWPEQFSKSTPQTDLITSSPLILAIFVFCLLTIGHSIKWMKMAEVNAAVLRRIITRYAKLEPHSLVILSYSEIDRENRFPESMAWAFSAALRLTYADPTVSGSIIHAGQCSTGSVSDLSLDERSLTGCSGRLRSLYCFVYRLDKDGKPEIIPGVSLDKLLTHY